MRKEKLEELNSLIESLRVVKFQKLETESHFLSTKTYNCTLKNGETIKREKLLKNNENGNASVILPVTNEGNVILTVEPKVFTTRTVGVSVPAGYINPGEYPLHAARRELLEETGYEVSDIYELGSFYQDTGVSGALIEYFLGLNATKTGEPHFDKGEIVKTFECTYEEALSLVEMGLIEDINAVLILERAKKYMLKRY